MREGKLQRETRRYFELLFSIGVIFFGGHVPASSVTAGDAADQDVFAARAQ
jgi:hypothetical protein